jgi:spermidine/putrescine transport system substrate-binding protein
VPKEGTNLFVDNLCIPKDAPHPGNALQFINHILDAAVNAEIAKTIHYATADAAARSLLPADETSNTTIYPPSDLIAKSEQVLDIGEATALYDRAWTEIQAA